MTTKEERLELLRTLRDEPGVPTHSEHIYERVMRHIDALEAQLAVSESAIENNIATARDVALGEAQAACEKARDERNRLAREASDGERAAIYKTAAYQAGGLANDIRALRTPAGEPPAEGQGGEG